MGSNGSHSSRRPLPGGMLRECAEPGCDTLTLGEACIAHERPAVGEHPRGVPHHGPSADTSLVGVWDPAPDQGRRAIVPR